jgi:KDO2-lipid IV(A) lauroyltransferase
MILVDHLSSVIPLRVVRGLAKWLGHVGYLVSVDTRRRVLKNLETGLSAELTAEQRKAVAKEAWINAVKGGFELFYASNSHGEEIFQSVSLEGKAHLDAALAEGRGVIAVTAHLGTFVLIGGRLLKEGYAFRSVIKEPRDGKMRDFLRELRRRQGSPLIPAAPEKECLRSILSTLRRNEIVCLTVDENRRRDGIVVDFLGRPAPTSRGPAVLSLRTGAKIVPMFILREPDDSHRIVIRPALEHVPSGDNDKDVYAVTLQMNKLISDYIRKYPSQWAWTNNRWKVLRKKGAA